MREKLLGELAARLAEAAAANPARDLEKNAAAVLSSAFARLDLVTREEYDVQSQVLARAREPLAELEARVAALEARPPPTDRGSAQAPARFREGVSHVGRRRLQPRPRGPRRAAGARRGARGRRACRGFHIVGLPETEVKEARDRVRAALAHRALRFPAAPRHREPRARGPSQGERPLRPAHRHRHPRGHRPGARGRRSARSSSPASSRCPGELRPIRGALAMTFGAHRDGRAFVLPKPRSRRGGARPGAIVHPARTLLEVCAHLAGREPPRARRRRARASGAAVARPRGRARPGAGAARARDRRGRRALAADLVTL